MNEILKRATELQDELSELRKEFHRWPEPGNSEYKTAERIEKYLQSLGIETRRVLGTAVAAALKGAKPGRTVALRADMDALPITEQTGADFASENPGFMHACGHDVHMTAALGAAKILSERKDSLCGNVVFLFQPDEEGNGGAARLIKEGCLDGVSMVFGAHVSPDITEGSAGINYGKFYAASDMFNVRITGKSAHGASPEKGIDALYAAARLICAFKAVPSLFNGEKSVVSTGKIESGSARNIIAEKAEFCGIIRTLGPEMRAAAKEAMKKSASEIDAEIGTVTDIEFIESYPGVVNNKDASALVYETARELLGMENAIEITEPTMMTEDFGYYIENIPGCFYHIGAGCNLPLHNSAFLPSEKAIVTGAALHAAVILKALL